MARFSISGRGGHGVLGTETLISCLELQHNKGPSNGNWPRYNHSYLQDSYTVIKPRPLPNFALPALLQLPNDKPFLFDAPASPAESRGRACVSVRCVCVCAKRRRHIPPSLWGRPKQPEPSLDPHCNTVSRKSYHCFSLGMNWARFLYCEKVELAGA